MTICSDYSYDWFGSIMCTIANSVFGHIWVLPEGVHSLSVIVPFTSTLLTMIVHPMLHCWPFKVNLVAFFLKSNGLCW